MENITLRNPELQTEIKELIKLNLTNTNLETILEEYHLYDITREIIDFEASDINILFNTITLDYAAELFAYFELNEAEEIIKIIGDDLTAKIISEMEYDDAVDLIKYLQKSGMRILKKIPADIRKELLKLMLYDEDEIGAYITDSYFKVNKNLSVKQIMKKLTNEAHDIDYISIIYVVNEDNILEGYIKLKDLIVARADQIIGDICEKRFPKIYPTDDKEYVAQLMQETSESSIPIINEDSKIEGIITYDDLMDIIALTQEEDYTRFAGLGEIELDLETYNLKKSIKSRLPWLTILLGLSLFTSIILSVFESSFTGSDGAKLLAAKLAVYLPLILDMSGNTGTQSLAVMIRYLTKNKDIDNQRIKNHVLREFRTGIFNGLLIGTLVFLMIAVTTVISNQGLSGRNLIYAFVASGSIAFSLVVSTTLGALVPLIMFKLKKDPAVASGPFITTISDIITLTIYYSISLLVLLPLFQ
jgi:magnesium transporter